MMELFRGNSYRLKSVNYFREKACSLMFASAQNAATLRCQFDLTKGMCIIYQIIQLKFRLLHLLFDKKLSGITEHLKPAFVTPDRCIHLVI